MQDDVSTLVPPPVATTTAGSVLAATIIYHPDVSRIGEVARLAGAEIELSRTTPEFAPIAGGAGRPITDRYVSRAPVKITRAGDGLRLEAPSTGRFAVNGRSLAGAAGAAWQTFDRDALARGLVVELADRAVVLLHLVANERESADAAGLVGDSDAVAQVRGAIARVADLDVPVMIRGETGTGKELVARAIHAAGKGGPFVAINVAAMPPTTAASELFGHMRGAFTGAAQDHEGLFARADGGTLFLDEIGETPFDVQPMLLRVLETNEVLPVGGSRSKKIDVRLIAATDADLETQIAESGFRSALFHRLAGYQLFVPPLRERRDDIGRLFIHFLRAELAATGDLARLEKQKDEARLWVPAALVARLACYHWPGNVRQLRNAARQLAISCRGTDEVKMDTALERLLGASVAAPLPVVAAPVEVVRSRRDPSEISDDDLLAALRANSWRAAGAAAQLGVSRSTFYNLIDKSKRIRKAKDIPDAELRRAFDACGGELDATAAELQVSRRALKLRIAELGWDE